MKHDRVTSTATGSTERLVREQEGRARRAHTRAAFRAAGRSRHRTGRRRNRGPVRAGPATGPPSSPPARGNWPPRPGAARPDAVSNNCAGSRRLFENVAEGLEQPSAATRKLATAMRNEGNVREPRTTSNGTARGRRAGALQRRGREEKGSCRSAEDRDSARRAPASWPGAEAGAAEDRPRNKGSERPTVPQRDELHQVRPGVT